MRLYGYAGTILRVDLSAAHVSRLPTEPYADALVGGRGIAARLYWDEVVPDTEAFDADNLLLFVLGPLAGLPVLGSSRWQVCGKSPASIPGQFSYSNLGGGWGAGLKFAGYDGIVVRGKSEAPVYLYLHDGVAELRDASALWGKGAVATRETLKAELGDSAKVVAIGPAGENMVVTASLLADNDASGSAGLGAVMGSKKLKAVVVAGGRRRVDVAQPERLKELGRYFRSLRKGVFAAWGTDFMVAGPNVKKDPCYGCAGDCLRVLYRAGDGTVGKSMCQSGMFYLRWAHRFYGERNEVPFYANRLCDDYGLDTWSLEAMIGWLHRCHRLGIVSEEAVGLPLSKLGSLEFIEALVKMLSLREGFGDLLARGTARAAEALGVDAAEQIRHVDPYDPRIYLSTALLWAMETREPIQELHEVGMPLAQFSSWAKKVEGAYVSGDVVRAVARRFWGSELAGDFSTCEGKALAAKRIQDRQRVKESLILCDFLFPVLTIEHSEDHVGDPTLESKLYSAVTGNELGEEELLAKGETIFNLQRAVLVRERRAGREADRLPEEWHSTPLKKGSMDPECLVTGPEGRVVSRVGSVVDRQEFERMKDEYYGLRGWDVATGLQTRSGLEQLGMKDVADDLERRGLLA